MKTGRSRFGVSLNSRGGWLRAAALAMLAGTLLGAQGCSWFRKGAKTDKKSAETPTDYKPAGADKQDLLVKPPDAPQESPRPVGLRPATPLLVIFFDFDKYNIRADQLDRLDQNLNYLKKNPKTNVLIEGHCDERGTNEYNFALGENRARAVMEYFVKNGVAADRLQTLSKGEEFPVDPGHGEESWTKNRRCEFKFFD